MRTLWILIEPRAYFAFSGRQDDDDGGDYFRNLLATAKRLLYRRKYLPGDRLLQAHSGTYAANAYTMWRVNLRQPA